jgi:hypothetical protein
MWCVPHECAAEEDCVDEGLDGGLFGGEAEPNGAHLLYVSSLIQLQS